jgi:hypothetical protein
MTKMIPTFEHKICDRCDQDVVLHKRSVSGLDASRLIRLYNISNQNPEREFFHLREFFQKGYNPSGDFAKLEHMHLIIKRPMDPRDRSKKYSGYWKITDKGKLWVEGKLTIPQYTHFFDAKVYGFSGKEQSIKDRLGKKFHYGKLMDGTLD